MNIENILDFLATKEVLIVLAIIGIILFVYFILWFLEFMKKHDEKKKLQNNTMELNKLVEEVAKANKEEERTLTETKETTKVEEVTNVQKIETPKPNVVTTPAAEEIPEIAINKEVASPIEIQPVIVNATPQVVSTNDSLILNDKFEEKVEIVEPTVITPVSSPKNEEEIIKYKDEVYTKTEAKQELERITEELKKLENEGTSENIQLTKYETEQEENAIISLDELLAKGKTLTEQNEITQYQDDGNEPISIKELEERYRDSKENIEVLTVEEDQKKENKISIDDFLGAKEEKKNTIPYQEKKGIYHPSPIISPIYGIEEEPVNKNTTLELENTANYQKFDEEIKKTNEFLSKLKELQQKLD